MKSPSTVATRLGRWPLVWILLLGLTAAPALLAEEMSGSRAKKANKEAAAALAAGDLAKARELYQQVATGALKTPAQRVEALYALILLEAGKPAASRDAAFLAATAATFVKDFPKDARKGLVAALAAFQAESQGQATQIAALEAQIAATAAELAQKEQAAAGASKDSGKRVEELEAKLRRASNEIENLKAELAKKEEALKKLKKVVVGAGG